jgi:hypothetical protein
MSMGLEQLLQMSGLVCCWNFSGDDPYRSLAQHAYRLSEGAGPIKLTDGGVLGLRSLNIDEGGYLYIPRDECPALNIYGSDAQVTVLAWIKRHRKHFDQCEAIAGMWNETKKMRQYCLFLNIQLYDSANQVCGHISGVGGPTPGEIWCVDVSIGATPVPYNEWQFVGFTYDGKQISSYLNGEPDIRDGRNPYLYAPGIFEGGNIGSDFTIGAVHRGGEMGNFYAGAISGVAVFNRALDEGEIRKIHADNPLPANSNFTK